MWREDVALMREAGVTLVTVGVFSWARLQPGPDQWSLEWLDVATAGTVLHGTASDDGVRLGPREVAVVEEPSG